MPEKDGSDDKKSTKSVINKKQKQFMNKEQLDLTSVAESFGGKIVGEPVELDEFKTANPVTATVSKVKLNKVKTGNPVLDGIITGGLLGVQASKWYDKFITPRLNPLPKYKDLPQFKDIKKYEKKDGVTKLYTNDELIKKRKELETKNKEKENNVIKRDMIVTPPDKEIEKISPPKTDTPKTDTPTKVDKPKTDTPQPVEVDKKTTFDPQKQVDNKSNNIDKKNTTIVKPTDKSGSETKNVNKTNLLAVPLLTRIRNRTRTKVGTGKSGIPKLPRLPGTSHNVGRRVNPQ